MNIKTHLREALNSKLQRFGHTLVADRMLYEWQKASFRAGPGHASPDLPHGAAGYLTQSNPRLQELQRRYASFNDQVTAAFVWTHTHVTPQDMLYFRGDNAYVWQVRERTMNIMAYALTAYYVQSIDELGLLNRLEEDDCFGIHRFTIANRSVSRDLLDSICEIYFLEKHLNISSRPNISLLDIGAGYGRLAHRMLNSLPGVQRYLCTDAFAISTFISEFYLRFRKLEGRGQVVALDEIDQVLCTASVDIALNIHSFSECKVSAIKWWLSLLQKHAVKYLMIVPNTGATLRTHEGADFAGIIEEHGYRLKAKEPKYRDPVVQQYGINPAYHYLFELME